MSLIDRALGSAAPSPSSRLAVDRIACAGRGICAHILPDAIHLDEWGYPILRDSDLDPAAAAAAVKLCPAKALRWTHGRPTRA